MTRCIFVSDLHGRTDRYQKMFGYIRTEKPAAVFLGGDLLPHQHLSLNKLNPFHQDFIHHLLVPELKELRRNLDQDYPRIFLILGNDDARYEEASVLETASRGFWEYINLRHARLGQYRVYGYAFIPPSPFLLKDWEKYDVSRYCDPGCVSPEEGHRTVPTSKEEQKFGTIQEDLNQLAGKKPQRNSIFLFHSPPYQSNLDRADLDERTIEHVPLDVHIGSIAIRRFIEERQPHITLHGHVHESARLTGSWQDKIGRTHMFSAAHDGPELAVVEFDADHPETATRRLL